MKNDYENGKKSIIQCPSINQSDGPTPYKIGIGQERIGYNARIQNEDKRSKARRLLSLSCPDSKFTPSFAPKYTGQNGININCMNQMLAQDPLQ